MFIKKYQNTAVCLCQKCAVKLCTEIADYGIAKGLEKLKGGEQEWIYQQNVVAVLVHLYANTKKFTKTALKQY